MKKNNNFEKICILTVIVSQNHANYFINRIINEIDVNYCYTLSGRGSAANAIHRALDIDNHKSIIMFLIKESLIKKANKIIEDRFSISKYAKGISFIIKIDSMIGYILYNFLINQKKIKYIKKENKK